MKKLLILTLAVFSFLACSDNEANIDPIVGTWHQFSRGGTEVSDCEKKSSYTFTENGIFTGISYEDYEGCNKLDSEGSAKWEKIGDNRYRIYTDSNPTGVTTTILFSDNDKTMNITEENHIWKK